MQFSTFYSFLLIFAALGLELRALYLLRQVLHHFSHSVNPFFVMGFFELVSQEPFAGLKL
jgi:hypothetical protein